MLRFKKNPAFIWLENSSGFGFKI